MSAKKRYKIVLFLIIALAAVFGGRPETIAKSKPSPENPHISASEKPAATVSREDTASGNSMDIFRHFHLIGGAGGSQASCAIVLNTLTGTQGLYRIGDQIVNARISEITPDYIRLNSGEESVVIAKDISRDPINRSRSAQDGPGDRLERNIAIVRFALKEMLDDVYPVTEMLDAEGTEARSKDGGIVVAYVPESSVFDFFGFEVGDMIVRVNGMKVEAASDVEDRLKEVAAAESSDSDIEFLRESSEGRILLHLE